MRRTLKRTKSKKQQGRVRDLKPVKEVKGSGKIEHAVERHETAVTEDAKELKKLREEVTQIRSDIAHIYVRGITNFRDVGTNVAN